MKILSITTKGISLTITTLLCLPLPGVRAEESPPPPAALPVIITELQTGQTGMSGGKAADEFIELYNTSDVMQDITGWQLLYYAAAAQDITSRPTLEVTLVGLDGELLLIAPYQHLVIHAGTVVMPAEVLGQVYDNTSSSITKTGGSVVLLRPDELSCSWISQDSLAWQGGMFGEGAAINVASTSKDKSFQRYVSGSGKYVDTNNNAADFKVRDMVAPSPSTPGVVSLDVTEVQVPTEVTPLRRVIADCSLPDVDTSDTEPPQTVPPADEPPASQASNTPQVEDTSPLPVFPVSDIGLTSPQISELLPNPGTPQTDAADEFIELYNSNVTAFDLSGFTLEVGLTTKHHYTLPAGTMLDAKAFKAFFSAETGLAMSNSSGQVKLLDPYGNIIASTDVYATAKDNQAWVRMGGVWQWTLTPTPAAANVVSAPAGSKKKAASGSSTKTSAATVSAKKTASSQKTVASTPNALVAEVAKETPIHAGILAAVGVSAVLYGVYEYRHDLANKLFQLRSYRAARRETRKSAEGR